MSRIQHKRGTASNLATVNPTPLAGELVYVSDENALKVGNGTTAWTSLAYVTATPRSHKSSHATGGSDALSPSDIGAAALSGATFTGAVEFDRTVANSSATALVVDGNFSTTSNAEVVTLGVFSDVRKTVSSGVTDSGKLFGGQFDAVADGDGTLAEAYGVYARAVNLGEGNLTTATAIYAHVIGGTTGYGVYIAAGSATTSWGVYQAGTEKNYFAGNVGIGVSPTSALHVNGTVDCDGLIVGTTTASATGISLLGAADAAAARTTLGAAPAASPAITGNATFSASAGVPVTITNTGTGNSFVVNDEASDASPFVIGSSGLVGIGVEPTSRRLTVRGSSTGDGAVLLQSSSTGTGASNGFIIQCFGASSDAYVWNFENAPIIFGANNAERMRLYADGKLDVTNSVWAVNGSAGSPGFTFRNDTNTGIFQASGSADTLSISTAGVERLRVDSLGRLFVYANGAERMRVDASGRVGIATDGPTAILDVNSNIIRLRTAKTPASASDTGNAGDICWDASYLYICTATNTWRRIAHSTW